MKHLGDIPDSFMKFSFRPIALARFDYSIGRCTTESRVRVGSNPSQRIELGDK